MTLERLDEIKLTPLLDTLRLQKIDDEVYFSSEYKDYISNSRLNLIDPRKDGSPEKFFEGFKPIYNPSFDLGSYTHQLVLQKNLFKMVDSVNKPTAKMGMLADRLYKFYISNELNDEYIIKEATIIDYYGGNLNEAKLKNVVEKCIPYWNARRQFESTFSGDEQLIYTDEKSRETVLNCVRALNSNQYVQELLHPVGLINPVISENELAILLDIKVDTPDNKSFILRFKAKLDNYTIDTDSNTIYVNDVKTIGKILSEFDNNISRFSYNREIAIYSWLLSLCADKYYGLKNPIVKGNYLVVSTIPQYYTKVVPMTKKMYKEGWEDFKYLIKLVAYYTNELF